MRRFLVLAVLAAASLLMVDPAPVAADTPGCVTRNEYNQIRRGATRSRVTSVFDIPGRVTSQGGSGGYAFENRDYRPCTGRPYSFVTVTFSKEPGTIFTVDGKFAYWG